MSFQEATSAHHERLRLEAALVVLIESSDFTEMWQVRDFVRYVLDGNDKNEAACKVFGQ